MAVKRLGVDIIGRRFRYTAWQCARMYPSGERAWCLRRVIPQKEFACHNCGSGSFITFIIKSRTVVHEEFSRARRRPELR